MYSKRTSIFILATLGFITICLLALYILMLLDPVTEQVAIQPTPSPVATIKPTVTVIATILPTQKPIVSITPSPTKKLDFSEVSRINTSEKIVVFTFDAGSGTQSASKVMETLKAHDLQATFFMTGKWMEQNPQLVKAIHEEGHEIFNHTYSHPNLTTIEDEKIIAELKQTEAICLKILESGCKPYFRPPYGARDKRVWKVAADEGYRSIYWTVDALDWKESVGITEAEVKARVMDNLAPGNIYLMHLGDNITGNVLDQLIKEITAKGYEIKQLSAALAD